MARVADLTTLLGRIRRRLRWQAAVEGAVAGGAAAGLAIAAGVAFGRARGSIALPHLPGLMVAGLVTGALAGAAVRGGRQIPLGRCAPHCAQYWGVPNVIASPWARWCEPS